MTSTKLKAVLLGLATNAFIVSVLYAGPPITVVAVTYQTPPGFGSATYFQNFGGRSPALDDNGKVIFFAHLAGTGINSTNDTAVFAGSPGALQLVAQKGAPSPKSNASQFLGGFGPLGIDTSGNVLIGDNSADGTFDLFAGPLGGSLSVLAQPGDTVPGASGPIQDITGTINGFNGYAQAAAFSNGIAVFGARLGQDSQFSLVTNSPGSLTLIAEPGMPAPGRPAGTTFIKLTPSWHNLNRAI
jgi:hypothetical protein